MDYRNFEAEDFALDASFQRWVQRPDPVSEAFWRSWMAANPDKETVIDEARHLVEELHFERRRLTSLELDEALARVQQQINRRQLPVTSLTARMAPRRTERRPWKQAGGIAATLLLLASGYWAWLQVPVHYETKRGEMLTLWLPDSSKVVLNGDSRLTYDRQWSQATVREVQLEGEAYFTVREELADGKPVKFQVHTRDVTVEVIGTRFNVREAAEKTDVVLESGNVQLRLAGQPHLVRMQPGDRVAYSAQSKQLEQEVVKPAPYLAWKDHQFVFEATPLSEVASIIEARYKMEVRIETPDLGNKQITGTIKSDRLEQLLEALRLSFGLRIEEHENSLILKE
ncbi:ferric-dicitrate binding protein FerR, regulates iron transport through sigma-19 [Catalinimonas alkaloidigena]|uniref:Ferric-dicitrate binding protein FerR, regulates iron transport through sigma-19 n=1 Tax=Catalinimonas alkaloidigena TaxID=1075417 RepID=A0A1G9QES4_9BACT|nr:FecR domain-containing protein [Catalinimonas alkaloidigena]SDM09572.1 ferric-dicitrate binding protein FerR, regulates iron transport through sigma-19 [Catalinimonas alkaloidigena]